jgi:predicted phosphohydrolase
MKIKLLSDLHLELAPYSISKGDEDILILAGDISPNTEKSIELITNYLTDNPTNTVIYILGNHDYYGHTIKETYDFWEHVNLSRFHYLQNTSIVINGYRFFGSTLWTDMNNYDMKTVLASSICINDYHQIKENIQTEIFTPTKTYIIHNKSKEILIDILNTSKEPVVVITHHLPSYKSIHPKYSHLSDTNGAYASHLDDLVKLSYMWMHGHTHSSFDYKIGDTRVICNPRGYCKKGFDYIKKENKRFDDNFIIEIQDKK